MLWSARFAETDINAFLAPDDTGAAARQSAFRSCRHTLRLIGVGKGLALPALRTVRAVLPHTALQSVVSSSGVSRLLEGCMKGEQSLGREERVGLALMIGLASSDAGALLLLAQDGAQSSANEAVDDAEQSWCGMFEVA